MWCGGNEFDPDCPENKSIVDGLENLCEEYDPTRDFHRASPYGGNSHSHQVKWFNRQYYAHFGRDLSPAIAEFSLPSPPCLDTLERILPEEELRHWPPDTPENLSRFAAEGWQRKSQRKESAFSHHDAHLYRVVEVAFPFLSDFGIPHNWDEFVRYAQTAQGVLTQFGIDFWRSRWPECTMTMSWVFNVIWPSAMTWEYVDWFGVPKISYYYQKRAYEPLHVGAVFDRVFNPPGSAFRAKLFVSNDTMNDLCDAGIRVRFYDQRLSLLKERCYPVSVSHNSAQHGGFFRYGLPNSSGGKIYFLCVDLMDEREQVLSRSVYTPRVGEPPTESVYLREGPWISQVKDWPTNLKADWKQSWTKQDDSSFRATVAIRNTGTRPAYQVSLSTPGNDSLTSYSDNFFWLEPGETRDIDMRSTIPQTKVAIGAWNASGCVCQAQE